MSFMSSFQPEQPGYVLPGAPRESYRLLAMKLMEEYLPALKGDAHWAEICKDHTGGTTCGHFVFWLLWKIGVQTAEHINREEPPAFRYADSMNMSVVRTGKGGNGTSRFHSIWKKEAGFWDGTDRPQPGDVCLIQKYENEQYVTNTDHVFVIYKAVASQCYEIAQGGTGAGSLECARGYFRFSNAGGHVRSDGSGRMLVGWLPLDKLAIGAPR